jgi:hypothetical protein
LDDPSHKAEAVIGAGRGALVVAMFGAGWLGWGLGEAKAFNGFVGPTFGFMALLLFVCSMYAIQKGRLLRKNYPAARGSQRQIMLKWFLVVVLTEILAIVLVSILANRLHRGDLAADWCAIIVGLHFLPLAKIFRAPNLSVLGILMIFWSALCWVVFRSNMIAISVSIGTGILLWGGCVSALLRARRIMHSLNV